MLYQQLHLGDPPYLIGFRKHLPCTLHYHQEIELFYCVTGEYVIYIDRKEYRMRQGDLAIIGPMVPHELPENDPSSDPQCLVIGAGPTMLGKFYHIFSGSTFDNPIFPLKHDSHWELTALLEETFFHYRNPTPFSSLIIRGNIYRIFANILKEFTVQDDNTHLSKKTLSTLLIETVLERIYHDYYQPLTVEDMATLCGYSKSNFCKIFRQITGKTFHAVLNEHRIEMARALLHDTQLPVEDIAARVGFSDAKSFCRNFKTVVGVTPGNYRKQMGD